MRRTGRRQKRDAAVRRAHRKLRGADMDERLFAQLAARLAGEAVVVASVVETVGATPRKRGARMLVGADWTAFSIGGGLAEARTTAAARTLLGHADTTAALVIDLGGGPDAAGVCGGRMQLKLRRWAGADDRLRALQAAAELAAGRRVALPEDYDSLPLLPDPRLLVIGAGHCGAALCAAARLLDFDLAVFDTRADFLADPAFAGLATYGGDVSGLAAALATPREVYAVLLNRDFAADISCLRELCRKPPAFIGMMGSRRRIRQVVEALPEQAAMLADLRAPVGLDIAAETPAEIAISILAQLIRERSGAG